MRTLRNTLLAAALGVLLSVATLALSASSAAAAPIPADPFYGCWVSVSKPGFDSGNHATAITRGVASCTDGVVVASQLTLQRASSAGWVNYRSTALRVQSSVDNDPGTGIAVSRVLRSACLNTHLATWRARFYIRLTIPHRTWRQARYFYSGAWRTGCGGAGA